MRDEEDLVGSRVPRDREPPGVVGTDLRAVRVLDDDEWAELDRLVERQERIFRALRYVALVAAFTLLMFIIIRFVAAHSTPMSQDLWSMECQKALRHLKGE